MLVCQWLQSLSETDIKLTGEACSDSNISSGGQLAIGTPTLQQYGKIDLEIQS